MAAVLERIHQKITFAYFPTRFLVELVSDVGVIIALQAMPNAWFQTGRVWSSPVTNASSVPSLSLLSSESNNSSLVSNLITANCSSLNASLGFNQTGLNCTERVPTIVKDDFLNFTLSNMFVFLVIMKWCITALKIMEARDLLSLISALVSWGPNSDSVQQSDLIKRAKTQRPVYENPNMNEKEVVVTVIRNVMANKFSSWWWENSMTVDAWREYFKIKSYWTFWYQDVSVHHSVGGWLHVLINDWGLVLTQSILFILSACGLSAYAYGNALGLAGNYISGYEVFSLIASVLLTHGPKAFDLIVLTVMYLYVKLGVLGTVFIGDDELIELGTHRAIGNGREIDYLIKVLDRVQQLKSVREWCEFTVSQQLAGVQLTDALMKTAEPTFEMQTEKKKSFSEPAQGDFIQNTARLQPVLSSPNNTQPSRNQSGQSSNSAQPMKATQKVEYVLGDDDEDEEFS